MDNQVLQMKNGMKKERFGFPTNGRTTSQTKREKKYQK